MKRFSFITGAARQFMLLTRVVWDFVKAIYAFRLEGPCVTVFGSARLPSDAPVGEIARLLGKELAQSGFTIMTGGGPGLMEAANRGAREAGGRSIACRISLSYKQEKSSYLDRCVTFRYFFVRKVMLFRLSCAFVVLPGGLGTLDELFEAFTLIQTGKIAPMPIVLFGRAYWQPLLNLIKQMVAAGTIRTEEMDLIMSCVVATDDVNEVIAHVAAATLQIGRRGPSSYAAAARKSAASASTADFYITRLASRASQEIFTSKAISNPDQAK